MRKEVATKVILKQSFKYHFSINIIYDTTQTFDLQ